MKSLLANRIRMFWPHFDTLEIAGRLGVPEHIVYNILARMKGDTEKTNFSRRDNRTAARAWVRQ